MQVHHNGDLDYLRQAPESGPVKQVIVLLHGYGRDASLMKKQADAVASRLPQALILMPNAPELLDGDVSDVGNMLRMPEQLRGDDPHGARLRRQWFSIRAARLADMAQNLHGAAQRVNEFLSAQLAAHGLKDSDAALMGFSQGGVVALYAAYGRAQPVACVVSHSAIFMGGAGLISRPPTLYLYGLDDEEFTPQRYAEAAGHVQAHIPQVDVQAIAGLRHTTNTESRTIVADYIAGHFK